MPTAVLLLIKPLAVGVTGLIHLEHRGERSVLDGVPRGVRRVSWRPLVDGL